MTSKAQEQEIPPVKKTPLVYTAKVLVREQVFHPATSGDGFTKVLEARPQLTFEVKDVDCPSDARKKARKVFKDKFQGMFRILQFCYLEKGQLQMDIIQAQMLPTTVNRPGSVAKRPGGKQLPPGR